MAIAAATAALASRFASSSDLVETTWVERAGSSFAAVCAFSGAEFPKVPWELPLTGKCDLIAGLRRGIAGMIRPFFGPVGTGFADTEFSLFSKGAGGARAAATSGFVSVGGGGGALRGTAGSGVVDALGNLTVATGFSGVSFSGLGSGSLFVAVEADAGCWGAAGPGGPCTACC